MPTPHNQEPLLSHPESPKHTMYYYKHTLGEKTLQSVTMEADANEYIETILADTQQQLLDEFPSNLEGLNMARIDGFMHKLDLRRAPLLVVDQEQMSDVFEFIEQELGISYSSEHQGRYIPELDLAIAFRFKELEQKNGPEYTESNIVHELLHGSLRSLAMRVSVENDNSLYPAVPRVGYLLRTHQGEMNGNLLEEGFASYTAAKYVTEELGLKRGLVRDAPKATFKATDSLTGLVVVKHAKYAYLRADGSLGAANASDAGAVMDILIDKQPELFPALLEARRGVKGLRDVASKIDGIYPGLYHTLRNNFNSEAEFGQGLKYVSDILGTGTTPDQ